MYILEKRLETDGYYSITVRSDVKPDLNDVHSEQVIRITCNNGSQTKAILSAMNKHLSLIQGPPG